MNATQAAILAAHEIDPEQVRARAEEEARQRRIAGAKMRREIAELRAQLDPKKVACHERFMTSIGRVRNPQAVQR